MLRLVIKGTADSLAAECRERVIEYLSMREPHLSWPCVIAYVDEEYLPKIVEWFLSSPHPVPVGGYEFGTLLLYTFVESYCYNCGNLAKDDPKYTVCSACSSPR